MDASDLEKLAKQFVHKAVVVNPNDNIWIEYQGANALPLANACAKEVASVSGKSVLFDCVSATINRDVANFSAEDFIAYGQRKLERNQSMQGYIRIRDNADEEFYDLSPGAMKLYKAAIRATIDYRANNMRWLVVSAPTQEYAAKLGMPYLEFCSSYKDFCLVDYGLMTQAAQPLEALMTIGKTVRIFSPIQETDLSFSIEGIQAVSCTGKRNIPDGECYTAPVRDSINGTIKFGPSAYDGERFKFIKLTFENGQVTKAEADSPERTRRLNQMLDTDPGARYAGEFAISFNPFIQHPNGDILFDEKIDGALHLALGNCYKATDNGNASAIHWDMVHIQRPDYGGGEIWIDDRLIRKDGQFMVPELLALNPENLTKAVGGELTRELDVPPKPPARPAPPR